MKSWKYHRICGEMGNMIKHFGPQADGSFSSSMVFSTTNVCKLYAPFNCGISIFRTPEPENIKYIALKIYWYKEIINEISNNNIFCELPHYIVIKDDDIDFIGTRSTFIIQQLQKPPRNSHFDANSDEDKGRYLLELENGNEELFFKAGDEIGETISDKIEMMIFTSPQIRPHIDLIETNAAWHEIEIRNMMDPVSFFYGFYRLGADFFQNIDDYSKIHHWFVDNVDINNRIILELRNEYNVPLLNTEGNASEIKLSSDGSQIATAAESVGGYFLISGNRTNIDIETKLPANPVVSILKEQYFFFDMINNRLIMNSSLPDPIRLEGPCHLVIQALKPSKWFAEQEAVADSNIPMPLEVSDKLKWYTVRNKAIPIIDGNEYFDSLQTDIYTVDNSNASHSINFAAWSMDIDFKLPMPKAFISIGGTSPDYPGPLEERTLQEVLSEKKDRVRLLIWDNMFAKEANMKALNFINDFIFEGINTPLNTVCKAILDVRQSFALMSANHMKICTISNSNCDMIGYCGGIDIYKDRITDGYHINSMRDSVAEFKGQHDTMARIEGEAAYELNRLLYKRWIDSDINDIPPQTPNKAAFNNKTYNGNNDEGTVLVQIANTIDHRPDPPYCFAKDGDTTIYRTIKNAILNAKQYIYIEDQYFRDQNVIDELEVPLSKGVFVIIVMPEVMWDSKAEIAVGLPEFIDPWFDFTPNWDEPVERTENLRNTYKELFSVYYPVNTHNENEEDIYVHSKLWIIDDIFVSCGSSNIDRKGMGSDPNSATSCECNGFYIDEQLTNNKSRKFARDFRIRLWSEHLFEKPFSKDIPVENSLYYEALSDPISAIKNFWLNPGTNGRIRKFSD